MDFEKNSLSFHADDESMLQNFPFQPALKASSNLERGRKSIFTGVVCKQRKANDLEEKMAFSSLLHHLFIWLARYAPILHDSSESVPSVQFRFFLKGTTPCFYLVLNGCQKMCSSKKTTLTNSRALIK